MCYDNSVTIKMGYSNNVAIIMCNNNNKNYRITSNITQTQTADILPRLTEWLFWLSRFLPEGFGACSWAQQLCCLLRRKTSTPRTTRLYCCHGNDSYLSILWYGTLTWCTFFIGARDLAVFPACAVFTSVLERFSGFVRFLVGFAHNWVWKEPMWGFAHKWVWKVSKCGFAHNEYKSLLMNSKGTKVRFRKHR